MGFIDRISELLFRERQQAQQQNPPLKHKRYKARVARGKKARKVFPIAHRTLKSFQSGQFRPFSLNHRRRFAA